MDSATGDEDDQLRTRKFLLLMGGALLLIVVIALKLTGDDDAPIDARSSEPVVTLASQTSTSLADNAERPDSAVPPIDCKDILTFADVSEALGVDDNPQLSGSSSELSRAEVCTQTMAEDERYFVQVSPSGPSDFEAGTTLIGVEATEVAGVGERAVWFGGPAAEDGGTKGVLAVEETSEHGRLFVRIFIGRPDVDEAAMQAIAVGLAETALSRFPGVEQESTAPIAPVEFTFTEATAEPPDTAGNGLGANLLAREERGDWTRAEGLLASLAYLAGETDGDAVLATPDLDEPSATLVVMLAREYLEGDPDPEVASEVERLLTALTTHPVVEEEPSGRTGGSLPFESGLALLQQEGADEATAGQVCADAEPELPCFERIALPEREGVPTGKYILWVERDVGSRWTDAYIDAAAAGVLDAAATFESLGELAKTTVVLRVGGVLMSADVWRAECEISISDSLTTTFGPDTRFGQAVAREMAFCLIGKEFRSVLVGHLDEAAWWTRGLATYLSGVVYTSANAEHLRNPVLLAGHELTTTFTQRSWTNWAFFEHLHSSIGAEGNLANISRFPVAGDHAAALAAIPGMADEFHEFERRLSDSALVDIGGGLVPFEPDAWDLEVFVPVTAELAVKRFEVRRIAIEVQPGQLACVETTQSGEGLVSWRPEGGEWSEEPPTQLDGESVLVFTTVEALARLTITVTDVTEDESCEEDEQAPTTTLGECDLACGSSSYYYA